MICRSLAIIIIKHMQWDTTSLITLENSDSNTFNLIQEWTVTAL